MGWLTLTLTQTVTLTLTQTVTLTLTPTLTLAHPRVVDHAEEAAAARPQVSPALHRRGGRRDLGRV